MSADGRALGVSRIGLLRRHRREDEQAWKGEEAAEGCAQHRPVLAATNAVTQARAESSASHGSDEHDLHGVGELEQFGEHD